MALLSFTTVQLPPNSIKFITTTTTTARNKSWLLFTRCCSNTNSAPPPPPPPPSAAVGPSSTVVKKRRKRYRKPYPGESQGITEEMRFVAMRLRNINGKYNPNNTDGGDVIQNDVILSTEEKENVVVVGGGEGDGEGESWVPSMEGFVKYLVDSKLVFDTVEHIVDKSDDVSFAYFRRTGLERSVGIARDLAWISEQGVVIPEPGNPGTSYAKYLEDLADKSAPLFLSHFYNIYFSHIAGGQVIARQVSNKLLEGRELEFYKWDGDAQELLKGLRENINKLGEHWTRDVTNKCLKEAKKSFGYLGQIVRLIIL